MSDQNATETETSWMDQIGGARMSEGGIYVLPGVYEELEIQKFKQGKTRDGKTFVVAELKAIRSSVAERPVGSLFDWYVDMSKEPSPGNIAAFLMTALGATKQAEITGKVVQFCLGPDQPLRGKRLAASASQIKTKKGGDFTKVKWCKVGDAAKLAAEDAAKAK